MTEAKVVVSFEDITQRLKSMQLPDVDLVVGIATGGIVPASLAAYQLGKPLRILQINYRAPDNSPRYDSPQLLQMPEIPIDCQHILLVDDVSVTGSTLQVAADLLSGYELTTLVMKGRGDFVVLPEIAACVQWPWKLPDV